MSIPGNFQAPFPFTSFQYGDVRLKEAGYIGTTPYFTRRAIGEWLGYRNPQNAIDSIVKRNPHISNPEWSAPVKLSGTDGKIYTISVYNPIGLQLIVFESRQPRAIQYKVAVARLVNDIMTGEYTRRVTADIISGRMRLDVPMLTPVKN